MEDEVFARWSLRCARLLSRRGLGELAIGAAAALGLVTDAEGKKKRKKKRKKPCKGGTTRCGNACVNTTSSTTHCGGCNQGCAGNEVCLTGACSRYRFVTAWGSEGDGDDQFSALHAIALDTGDSVYAVDTGNHRVQKFDSGGRFLTKWGKDNNKEGTGNGEFAFPEGIDVAPDGRVRQRPQQLPRAVVRRRRRFPGHLARGRWSDTPFGPEAIAVDSASNAFVVDRLGHRIVKFDSDGAVLATLEDSVGQANSTDRKGSPSMWTATSSSPTVTTIASRSSRRTLRILMSTAWPRRSAARTAALATASSTTRLPLTSTATGNLFVADLAQPPHPEVRTERPGSRAVRLRHRLGLQWRRRRPVQQPIRHRGRRRRQRLRRRLPQPPHSEIRAGDVSRGYRLSAIRSYEPARQ